MLVIDSSVIPLQFLQRLRFPFFGNLTIPIFPSTGISSSSHISLKVSVRVSVMTSAPAFSISALTQSAPGAFPDFMLSVVGMTCHNAFVEMFSDLVRLLLGRLCVVVNRICILTSIKATV